MRRGVAVLWLAIAGLVVVLLWGFARSFVTSTARATADAGVEAELAASLAESAVAELEARIGQDANNLRSPVAAALRKPFPAGEVNLAPLVKLETTPALLKVPAFDGYALGEVSARVEREQALDTAAYEKRGLIVFAATVTSPGLVRRATRRVEVARWFKTTLTVPPRPLGNYGLFLGNAAGLTDTDAANHERDRAAGLVRRARAAARPQVAVQMLDPDAPHALPDPLALPAGTALYGLMAPGATQELRHLDLAARLREQNEVAERTGDPAAAVAPLSELWAFHHTYAALPPAHPAARDLKACLAKLTPAYFERRAHYRIAAEPGRPDLPAAVRTLLERPANGVALVENAAPLDLTGPVRGQLVLVLGPGGAHVHDLNAGGAGLLTLVTTTGPVRVSGRNVLALVVAEPPAGQSAAAVTFAPDARVRGALIACALGPGSRLDGVLERDDRLFAGLTRVDGSDLTMDDRTFAGLSPRVHYRRVVEP